MIDRPRGLIFLPVLPLLLLAGCGAPDDARDVEFRVPVTARNVQIGTVEDRIVATGTLRATEVISLRADSAGELETATGSSGRKLAEGDTVAAGQIIAEIKGEDVRLTARTEATRQRYEAAKRDYEDKKLLFEQGLIPALELRPLESAMTEARLEWERSLLTESRSRLVTPIAGIILRLARDETNSRLADGQLVMQGTEVAQIAPVDRLIADVDLVGPDVARVVPGQEARVRHHAWEDETFPGRVIRLAPSLDAVTRALRAEVEIRNSGRRLRPGMFVEVTVVAERRNDVPVVPRNAVTERGGEKVVFVVRGQKVVRRDVVLGLGDDDVVEVRSGLEAEERIVVKGLETLTDGAQVRVSGR